MNAFIHNLLNSHSHQWSQPQKEAIVDLCLLGMYSDDLISLAEQEFVEEESAQLQWQSGISFSGYLQRTIPKIRATKEDAQKVEALLQSIRDRLGSDESKRSATQELEKLLATDGVVQLEEAFLSQVKRVLGV